MHRLPHRNGQQVGQKVSLEEARTTKDNSFSLVLDTHRKTKQTDQTRFQKCSSKY